MMPLGSVKYSKDKQAVSKTADQDTESVKGVFQFSE